MLDTESRVDLVVSRARSRRRVQEKRSIRLLSSACAVLTLCIIGLVTSLSQPGMGDVVGLYGATIFYDQAGGYILVALVSFVAAVAITLGCRAYRRNTESRNRDNSFKKDEDHV